MSELEIKPCPFCGKDMMYVHFTTFKYLNPLRKCIVCNWCGGMMTADYNEIDEPHTEVALQYYIIDKWNRRANEK